MSIRNLDALFAPRSIALIGASNRGGSVGSVLARNLFGSGFAGPVMPVNPHERAIRSAVSYRSVADLPMTPDLAVIATPAAGVPAVVAELGARGCRAAVVISAGFGEGTLRQDLLDAARPTLLRILGPNGIGVISPRTGVNASFAHLTPKAGRADGRGDGLSRGAEDPVGRHHPQVRRRRRAARTRQRRHGRGGRPSHAEARRRATAGRGDPRVHGAADDRAPARPRADRRRQDRRDLRPCAPRRAGRDRGGGDRRPRRRLAAAERAAGARDDRSHQGFAPARRLPRPAGGRHRRRRLDARHAVADDRRHRRDHRDRHQPLLADETGVVALDARVVLAPAAGRHRSRFAIQPYPGELEETVTTRGGTPFHLRPIRPEDEPGLVAMLNRCDPEDIRLRFFAPMKTIGHAFAARLTQIDYSREMAFVACEMGVAGGEILGVARLISDPDEEVAEFGIMVRSDQKGRGPGYLLMGAILRHAARRGLRTVTGEVLAENASMLAMAGALGFRQRIHEDDIALRRVEIDVASAAIASAWAGLPAV